MVNRYREKRIYLVRISSRLTASSARYLFQIILPIIYRKVSLDGGDMEKLAVDKKTYLLILCNEKKLKEIDEQIKFVLSTKDVTDSVVNDHDYILDKILKQFSYVYFDNLYRKKYLDETPLWFAERRILLTKEKSRYIDHQVVYNHQK
jgi:hypothetical protein